MPNKNQPTRQEKRIATEMQAPTPLLTENTGEPQPLTKAGIFNQLMGQPMVDAARLLSGGKTVWIDVRDEINVLFPSNASFSRPFVVIRAWYFASKVATQKDRFGMKIALPDQNVYHISLPYPFKLNQDTGELEPLYPDRAAIVSHFETSTTPVGLMQFEKVDRGQSNPYWRLIYSDEHSMELAGEPMPDAAPSTDDGTPF